MKTSSRPTPRERRSSNGGFTLAEVLVGITVSSIVLGAAMYSFVWCLQTAAVSRQFSYAHVETVKSGMRMMRYLRNASSVHSIDGSGNWVQVTMPDGTISRFEYINPLNVDGQGQMQFVKDISTGVATNIVGKGLTKVMTLPARNVFQQTGTDTLRIAYRITQPLTPGECPVEIDTGVRLRN